MENGLIQYLDAFYTFVADLLALDEVPKLSITEDIDTACAYSNGTILINVKLFPLDNSLFMFIALAHELRHAYQVQCLSCEKQDYFTEDQLDTIQNELSNYVPHGQNFKNQFIEFDAFGFAEFIINTCFGVKCLYNETFRDEELTKIHNKANEFKNVYLEDEIEQCMAFARFKPIKKGL